MDKLSQLRIRKEKLTDISKNLRKDIDSLIDPESFVELSAFSYSKGNSDDGEGVITGFATINDEPYYIVAQNFDTSAGGVSKANCDKMLKCLSMAQKNQTPVIYLLSTLGVKYGEGVSVLEGLASLIFKAAELKSFLPQYLILNGDVFGQISVLAGICDFAFFLNNKSVLCPNSPLVISANSGVNLNKNEVGGANALKNTSLTSFTVKDLKEVKATIIKLDGILSDAVTDEENLNEPVIALDKRCDLENLLKVFDKDELLEVGADFCPEVKCFFGRIGGISVASVIFDSADTVELNAENVRKLKDFASLAGKFELPYLTFVNAGGIKCDLNTNNSLVIKEIAAYVSVLNILDTGKISVVYKKAIGLGYTLFAAKNAGYDFTYAFANAEIALFDGVRGAEIELDGQSGSKKNLAEKYSDENANPFNAALGGFIDNIVQPSLIKQYLIASLQTFLR